MAIIRVDSLTKTYRRGTGGGLFRRADEQAFNALEEVSFEIREGEVVGVIGRNGAGKSTLLKILSEITAPTSGRVLLWGRVASLLEVGTGFHPDLTGRDNIYMNGAILGMRTAEIRARFDEIVAFSECEAFIDTPVKRYSSGMYVRLAFAVAAHLQTDVLIVDEVLAVGDSRFQQKCLGKMEEVGHGGRTILFVSHQLATVKALCSRSLLFERGRLVGDDATQPIIERYYTGVEEAPEARPPVGPDGVRIASWRLAGVAPEWAYICYSRDTVTFEITIESARTIERAHFGFVLTTMLGERIIAAQSLEGGRHRFVVRPGSLRIRITTRVPLHEGQYRLELTLSDQDNHIWDHWVARPLLSVVAGESTVLPHGRRGVVNEPITFDIG